MPIKPSPLTVKAKVEQLGEVLSELTRLCRDPSNATDFTRHEAALCAALSRHQFICSALRCATQDEPRLPQKAGRRRC